MPALSQTRAYVALLLCVLLWGTFPSTSKLAFQDLPPVLLTALRGVLASAFLVALVLRAGVDATRGLSRDSVRAFFVLGFCGMVVSMQVTYLGLSYTTAANGAILQAAAPVMVLIAARVYLGERLRRRQRLGIAASTLGVLLVVTDGNLATLSPDDLRPGDFLTLAALVGWSIYTVYGKRVLQTHAPLITTAGGYVCGTLMLIPIALVTMPLFPRPNLAAPLAWAIVAFHGILGALAHVLWNAAVQRVGASRAAIFMNVTPLVGMVLAVLLLEEPITPGQLLGVAFVLGGVALTTHTPRPETRQRDARHPDAAASEAD